MKELTFALLLRREVKYSVYALTAALEKKGIKVRWVRDPLEVLELKGNVALGISLLTTHLLDDELTMKIRLLKGKVTLIAGGPHATGDPYGTLKLGFDYVVKGEAEESLAELLEALQEGNPEEVKGIYLSDGSYTGPRKLIELDDYPPWPYWRGTFGPIEVTRGCPFACKYCQTSFIFKAIVRHRSVENVREYSKKLRELGGKDLRFISPNSLSYGGDGRRLELDKVEELLSAVKSTGVRVFFGSFPSEVRPEFVNEEALKVMRKYVSNKRIVIGAQSASDEVLKRLNRGHTWEDVVNAVQLSVEHGFTPEVDFILGLPGESEEEMMATLEGMRKLISMGARAHLHYFMPLPGTPFAFEKPAPLPQRVRKEIAKLVGEGKAWGQWLKQEEISWKVVELIEKGTIIVSPWLRQRNLIQT
ncbi:TIGR04013 family B12-binding domain/radical SAM domain-containing protein [Ignicoccus islandicus]|uniref:TIGR04013 family B12-binding domain/radical SAM domain-containing protein n=1 Tax=Ignicoccus islandicus TaxID=54259 RepID=UPI0009461746|nr:TIGR04013 family B12-binding domain/radical SAM domain-containing protein [Ignicoccus islandicus]